MINYALPAVLYKDVCVYLDDVIVWGNSVEEVLHRTEEVIELLKVQGLILSGMKSEFAL